MQERQQTQLMCCLPGAPTTAGSQTRQQLQEWEIKVERQTGCRAGSGFLSIPQGSVPGTEKREREIEPGFQGCRSLGWLVG